MGKESFVNLENARNDEQRAVMERLQAAGICPFCEGNQGAELKPELWRGKHWTVRENRWPYPFTLHHFLLISIKHTEKLSDLPIEAGADLLEMVQRIEKEFGIISGGLAMRFGEPTGNGGTVDHLHVHLVVADPDTSKPGYKPLRVRLGPSNE